jgi:hypothetical protein
VLLAAGILVGLPSAAVGFAGIVGSGQPGRLNGHYVLSSHGHTTEVSRSTYEEHVGNSLRAFAGIESIFLVIGLGGLWTQTKSSEPTHQDA